MRFLIHTTNKVFSVMFLPFTGMRPEYALVIITVASGVAMLYLYVWMSDQDALKKVQDRVKAHLLEIQLYKTDLYVMLRALARVFAKNFTYLRLLLVPALFLMLLVVVIVIQCYPRFEYRPLRPGEGFLFRAAVKDPGADLGEVRLDVPAGITVETAPLSVPSLDEVNWRLRARAAGEYDVSVRVGQEVQTRRLIIGDGLVGVSPKRAGWSFGNYLENPLEAPLSVGSRFKEIEVGYPEREIRSPLLLGMNWVIYYFVVSFLVALVVKFVTKAR